MRRRSAVLTIALTISSVTLGSTPILAKDLPPADNGTGGALLEALSRVPDTTAAREMPISYLDQAALVAARPGAAQPASLADGLAALEADDPAAHLWMAALMGASSGDLDLLRRLPQATRWPEALGFDLLDVERHLSFGTPPSDGTVVLGDFDSQAIADAYATRGYRASHVGDRTLLCGAAGCEAGMDVDLAAADPGLPFGAEIGRSEPLAVSTEVILDSADLATLEAMMAAADGESASLAEDRAYRALALATDPGVTLTQATILPGGMLGLGPDIYQLLGLSPAEAADLITQLGDSFEPMPAAEAVAIVDGATATEQVVTIALAFADEADAATAADVLPRRLQDGLAPSFDAPLSALLAEHGVTSVTASVVPAGAGTLPVARVEVRAPLADAEPDPATGAPAPSSDLYRLFIDMVMRRDLLWLVPVLPLE
jgi:hypothetical protein